MFRSSAVLKTYRPGKDAIEFSSRQNSGSKASRAIQSPQKASLNSNNSKKTVNKRQATGKSEGKQAIKWLVKSRSKHKTDAFLRVMLMVN